MHAISIGDGSTEVRQLQIFRTLAEELNFTRAAEKVHTVQSNALHWAGASLDISTGVLKHWDKWISPAMAAFISMVREKLEDSEGEDQNPEVEASAAD
jgi:hypothetical protein